MEPVGLQSKYYPVQIAASTYWSDAPLLIILAEKAGM